MLIKTLCCCEHLHSYEEYVTIVILWYLVKTYIQPAQGHDANLLYGCVTDTLSYIAPCKSGFLIQKSCTSLRTVNIIIIMMTTAVHKMSVAIPTRGCHI